MAKLGITLRVEAAVAAHASEEGGLVLADDAALEGKRLQAGQPRLQVQVFAVAAEFLPADMGGGDEQPLHAEDQVAEIVQPALQAGEHVAAAGLEAGLGFLRHMAREDAGGKKGNGHADGKDNRRARQGRQQASRGTGWAGSAGGCLHERSL